LFLSKKIKICTLSLASSFFLFVIAITIFHIYKSTSTPATPCPDKPLLIVSNHLGDPLNLIYLQAIEEAQDSILIFSYSISDPSVLQLLRKKAEEGVQVTIFYEPKTSKVVETVLFDVATIQRASLINKGIMHRKIMVIDTKTVWMGSANLTKDSLKLHDNTAIGIYLPKLAKDITLHAKEVLSNTKYVKAPVYSYNIDTMSFSLWLIPNEDSSLDYLINSIKQAKQSVRVGMFTWTHPSITNSIIEAHKRGLHVQVIIDRNSRWGTSKREIERLQNAGVEVRVSSSEGLFHHKFCLTDESNWILGSSNWTRSAFSRNVESFFTLSNINQETRKKLLQLWQQMLHSSNPNLEKTFKNAA
jgi:cardiolipin synthase A/B